MNDSIKITIQKQAGTYNKDYIDVQICTVNSVDMNAMTLDCTPIGGNAATDLAGVFLTADVPSDGMILQPAIGSTVLVGITLRNQYYLLMCSDIDAMFVNIPNGSGGWTVIQVNSSGIQLNDGSFGGMVEVAPLVAAINTLQNQLNALKTLFNAHIHTTPSGPSGVPTIPDSDPAITPTIRSDIENTKVIHGI